MTTTTEWTGRELRWLADNYEQAQRMRVESGERIRAVLQGRDETFVPEGRFVTVEREDEEGELEEVRCWVASDGHPYAPDEVLDGVVEGWTIGPVPMLGRTYRRFAREENATRTDMLYALGIHPAWPFLKEIPGIGPTLGAKLLGRLDARKAPYCSSFWKYCGLATVPGRRYGCDECGLVRGWPADFNVSGTHQAKDTNKKCPGTLEEIAGPEDGVKVAQPKPAKGEKSSYDQYAKKVCWQIGTSILQQGGRANVDSPYERYYRREKAKAVADRPGWNKGRIDHKARRKMVKLLLAHLWEVWRAELGLETPDPYVFEHEDGHYDYYDPWEFLEGEVV